MQNELVVYPLKLQEGVTDYGFLIYGYQHGTEIVTPVQAFLINGAEAPIIVDTGIGSPEISLKVHGINVTSKPEWDLVTQLKKLNVEPQDICYIIHTHLYYYHCSKDDLFPNAKIVVQRQELQFAAAPLERTNWGAENPERGAAFYERKLISKFVNEFWHRMVLLDGDTEIVKGVKCLRWGGHTPGSQVIFVETTEGTVVITGDLIYQYEQLELLSPTGNYYNLEQQMSAIHMLARMEKEGAFILPTHDERRCHDSRIPQ